MGFVQETARMLFSSMFHLRVSDFLSNINLASKLPVKLADKTAEYHCLFFLFLSFSCILQCVTGRNVGRQIQKCIQMSLIIIGVIHNMLEILLHFVATLCSVGFPAPAWCFTCLFSAEQLSEELVSKHWGPQWKLK